MLRLALVVSFVSFASLASALAQEPPKPEVRLFGPSGAPDWQYELHWPAANVRDAWHPVAVVFTKAALDEASPAAAALARAGFVVVRPDVSPPETRHARLVKILADVRRGVHVEQGGLHAVVADEADLALVRSCREEFQTITVHGDAVSADVEAVKRLPARRVRTADGDAADALARTVRTLHDERRQSGVAGEVSRVLDVFHEAAARADEAAYFDILPDDAVFLGTDGTERWTGAQFRAAMMKHFQDRSAWTYVALARHVDVEPGDTIAWFDETFDNAAYGECRGTGVLAKRDGRWVLRQYHLTVPVPNDLARDVAAQIRAFQERGVVEKPRTIVLVRHAEKADATADSPLSDAGKARAETLAKVLRDVKLRAVYTSEYARTRETVAPLCAGKGVPRYPVPAAQPKALLDQLAAEPSGSHVLVCGHSNTVPEILKALGVRERVTIADDEYDLLFVVTLTPGGARLLKLRY